MKDVELISIVAAILYAGAYDSNAMEEGFSIGESVERAMRITRIATARTEGGVWSRLPGTGDEAEAAGRAEYRRVTEGE